MGVTVIIRKWGSFQKFEMEANHRFMSRSKTFKTFFAIYDSDTNIGDVSNYNLHKFNPKTGYQHLYKKLRSLQSCHYI